MADGDWANAIAEDEGKLSNQVDLDLNFYLKRLFLKLHSTHKGEQALRSSKLPNGNFIWKVTMQSLKFYVLKD